MTSPVDEARWKVLRLTPRELLGLFQLGTYQVTEHPLPIDAVLVDVGAERDINYLGSERCIAVRLIVASAQFPSVSDGCEVPELPVTVVTRVPEPPTPSPTPPTPPPTPPTSKVNFGLWVGPVQSNNYTITEGTGTMNVVLGDNQFTMIHLQGLDAANLAGSFVKPPAWSSASRLRTLARWSILPLSGPRPLCKPNLTHDLGIVKKSRL
jgi:hypothetical protein